MITQRRLSTSSALAAVEASGERITVETLLIRNQKNREFERRAKEYLPDGPIVEPDLFTHKGVHYWEDNYEDVIVVPSLSLDPIELAKVKGITHYEERSLFNLILLRKPRVRLVYVTSVPLDPAIIEYYWKLMPERIPFSEITKRIIPLSVHDDSPKPLSQKLLEKPRLLQRIKKLIRNSESACLTCFNSTKYELELSEKLGIPLLATNPETVSWGTKEGSHAIFTEAGIPHPQHTKLCFSTEDLAKEIAVLWKRNPQCPTLVVKLNDSFTGEGNAMLSLDDIMPQADRHTLETIPLEELHQKISSAFPTLVFQSKIETWETFGTKVPVMGWLAELFIDGLNKTSPSGQACIDRNGEVTVLSTHEQVLGGDNKQVYLGCSFPSSDSYRLKVQEYTKKVGEVLASKGVIDHFSVDFVAYQTQEGEWELSAIEINLRQGGTTHPMMTLKLLTDGDYDEEEGHFVSIRGQRKFYVASDNICGEDLKAFVPQDLMETFGGTELHFNADTEKGCVFHLLGALSKYGKVGVTCIGDSPEEAQSIFDRTVEMLHQQAKVL